MAIVLVASDPLKLISGVGVVMIDNIVLYHTLILVVQISMLSEPGHASLAVCLMMREL